MAYSARPRRGFTLVEVLVVIAILGVLLGLLLPAVQSARESSRATTCRNHVSQLAKALLQNESAFGSFPSGGWGPLWLGVAERGSDYRQPGGWTFAVLPYLEESTLVKCVESADATNGPDRYRQLVTASIPIFSCPSRRSSRPLPVARGPYRAACSTSLAITEAIRIDYAANGGSAAFCPSLAVLKTAGSAGSGRQPQITICHKANGRTMTLPLAAAQGHANHPGDHLGACDSCSAAVDPANPTDIAEGDAWSSQTSVEERLNRPDGGLPDMQDGLFYRMSRVVPGMIRDGMSHTYLLGEKYVASDRVDSGDDPGDSGPAFVGFSSDNLRWAHEPPRRDARRAAAPNTFGSPHPAGVVMAWADGSVRLVAFDVDPGLHQAFAGRSDGLSVEPK